MKVDDTRAEEIAERCESATSGPWEACRYPVENGGLGPQTLVAVRNKPTIIADCEQGKPDSEGWTRQASNATFISRARTDLPDLLSDRAELLHELAVRDRALETLCEQMCCDENCPAYRGEVLCEEDCEEMHKRQAIETARAELATNADHRGCAG